jgi:phosphoribosylformimino-5-aminoimidazole carboxamide ribotide isomerase
MKIITAIDIMEGDVVRLIKGDPASKIVYSKDPIEIAKKWEMAGADMLHVVDLDAALCTGKNKYSS